MCVEILDVVCSDIYSDEFYFRGKLLRQLFNAVQFECMTLYSMQNVKPKLNDYCSRVTPNLHNAVFVGLYDMHRCLCID